MTEPGDESIDVFLESIAPGHMQDVDDAVRSSKVRRGIWLGENEPIPDAEGDLYSFVVAALACRGLSQTETSTKCAF